MGKIPTVAIIAIAAVLVIGISGLAFWFMVKPQQAVLADLKTQLEQEEGVAAQLDQAKNDLAEVEEKWFKAQDELAEVAERKSIHISMYHPVMAMTAIWYEYREDLPAVVEKFVRDMGCTIEQGASMPAPPMNPPTVDASGFMQVPAGQTLNLTVSGTLESIERLYLGLSELPRVATIGSLSLSGTGDRLTAQIPLTLYIYVEGAAAAAPAPAAGPGMDMMGPGMDMMGPPGMPGPPGMEGPPPGAAPGGPPPGDDMGMD